MSSSIRKEIQLTIANIERFEQLFPKGSLSWALDLLLEKFNAQFDHTPDEYAKLAAEELKEEIGK